MVRWMLLAMGASAAACADGYTGVLSADGGSSGGSSGALEECVVPDAQPLFNSGEVTLQSEVIGERTYDFDRGAFGEIVRDGTPYNQGAHLRFLSGNFVVAIQGGDYGTIVDLGYDRDVKARTGVGECTGFEGLAVVGGVFNDPNAEAVWTKQPNWNDQVAAIADHVYVIHITRDKPDLIVKLIVQELSADRVHFRWARITAP